MKNNKNGITLIALIITIIILLILAVVTIGSIKNSNIITYAQNASTDYNKKKAEEENAIVEYESLIKTNLLIGDVTILEAQSDSMLSKTTNSTIYDSYGNKIVVPAGFKILVDDTTGYTTDNIDVTKGIVIKDSEGNEFVWIPVGENITNGTKRATIKLSRYMFDEKTGEETDVGDAVAESYYQELATSSYGNATAKNLSGFISSANINKGYYIARYEAGVTGYDSSKITTSNSNKDTNWTGYVAEEGKELKLVCKYRQRVWNYVTQNKASELCRNMYDENSNYTSDLINSYAWDTAIVFIQTFSEESDASTYSILNKSTTIAFTGLNNDKYCNINDMSGNYWEWSTEARAATSSVCVYRGGLLSSHSGLPSDNTNNRDYTGVYYALIGHSFRPILYL